MNHSINILLQLLFWTCLLGTVYSYFIYPVILFLCPKKIKITKKIEEYEPKISLIVAAYNEEKRIKDKIENCLRLEYSAEKVEIIVASDASSDETDGIVQSYYEKNIKLVRLEQRQGKESAQIQAIGESTGDLIVFSDVSTSLDADALYKLIHLFSNNVIGAVSSRDKFISKDGVIAGEGLYVKYEMWLRSLESKANSLVGLSGSFFAARSEVCKHWDATIPSDFNTALICQGLGYSAISDNDIIGYYPDIISKGGEYKRKYRTVLRGISALFKKKEYMNPIAYGFFAFQLFSHKLMRWLVPWFMVMLLGLNILLIHSGLVYSIFMVLQLLFYIVAVTGLMSSSARKNKIVHFIAYFIEVNIAIMHAMIDYMRGKRITMWTPSKR